MDSYDSEKQLNINWVLSNRRAPTGEWLLFRAVQTQDSWIIQHRSFIISNGGLSLSKLEVKRSQAGESKQLRKDLRYGDDWKVGLELTFERAESSFCRAKWPDGGDCHFCLFG